MSLDLAPLPVVGAPMAGGVSTPALVAALGGAGGFGFLAAGYRTTTQLAGDIDAVRAFGTPFGVNLFVPGDTPIDPVEFARYRDRISGLAARFGIDLGAPACREPVSHDDEWAQKLDLLVRHPVDVVSLTFGVPRDDAVARLHAAGSRVLITVTTVDEARAASEAGADALIAQGSAAGGHSATFDSRRTVQPMPTPALVRAAIRATGLPVIGAGGIDGPAAVRAVTDVGAEAVAVGTLLLRSDESGASALHRDSLADPAFTETVITRSFTGRPARALRNAFVDEFDALAPSGYPEIHHLTHALRAAAVALGDPDAAHLWAGTGYRAAQERPAADIVRELATAL